MDWARAIIRNSEALRGIIEALFAMLGLAGEATVGRIPRPLHTAVLRILRPAESAVRRLIVIAARGLVVKPKPSRPMPAGRIIGRGGNPRASFQLFDPRKNFARRRRKSPRLVPRIYVFGSDSFVWSRPAPEPVAQPAPPPDDLVNAARLTRRLEALKLALDDLPRQARRLARWRLKRERERAKAPKFTSPLRPGRAPGYRKKPDHKVDDVLAECHWLAWEAMRPDTS